MGGAHSTHASEEKLTQSLVEVPERKVHLKGLIRTRLQWILKRNNVGPYRMNVPRSWYQWLVVMIPCVPQNRDNPILAEALLTLRRLMSYIYIYVSYIYIYSTYS